MRMQSDEDVDILLHTTYYTLHTTHYILHKLHITQATSATHSTKYTYYTYYTYYTHYTCKTHTSHATHTTHATYTAPTPYYAAHTTCPKLECFVKNFVEHFVIRFCLKKSDHKSLGGAMVLGANSKAFCKVLGSSPTTGQCHVLH